MYHNDVKDYTQENSKLGTLFLTRVYITSISTGYGWMKGTLLAKYKENSDYGVWQYIVLCDDYKQREFLFSELIVTNQKGKV